MPYFLYHLVLLLALFANWTPTVKTVHATAVEAPPGEGIQTSGGHSVESLVKDIFAKGACDNISNIRAIGHPDGIGYFEKGSSSIGMERGIIIATGSIKQGEGPNKAGDKSGNLNDFTGDPDLAMLSTHRILDAVGIEFDFTPLDSFVQFRYVFASEEYCEFVGSVYNDVFGFFVSGPGIQGSFSRNSKNVALIPGSNAYVSINSVNHTQNSSYFIRNELEKDAQQCGIEPVNSPYKQLIEYDGFTKILTATLQLIPCETYHIRFMVSDVADRHYDSAVFLEAESFNIGGTVQLNARSNNQNTSAEGCAEAFFEFKRGELEHLDKPLSVQFKIAASSTAVEGTDFERLPRTVVIPAGKKSIQLPVRFFNDGIAEAPEKLTIELDIPCACYSGAATLQVIDPPNISLRLPDGFACRGTSTILQPQVSGGVPPYTYQWNNGATTATISVTAASVNQYSVTITDQCGSSASDSCRVTPTQPPNAVLSGAAEICAGDTALLPVNLSGIPPFRFTMAINGERQSPIEITAFQNGSNLSGFIPATKNGQYEIVKLEDAGCTGATSGTATVNVIEIEIQPKVQAVSCAGGSDGAISIQPIAGNAPFRYQWSQNLGQQPYITKLQSGTYQVTVSDDKRCDRVFDIHITEPAPLLPLTFDCIDLTDPNFQFTAKGGTPPYTYSIDGSNFYDADLFQILEPGKTYELLVLDAADCALQQSFTLPPVYEKMVELPAQLELNIGEKYEFQPKVNIAHHLIDKIEWSNSTNLSCTHCLNPQLEALAEGAYTLKITDLFGCSGEATVQIRLDPNVDIYIPTAFSPNSDQTNDFFTVYANENQIKVIQSLKIFDRWGNQVFAAQNMLPNEERAGWDGYIDGKLPDAGVFVYVAAIQLRDNSTIVREGQIILIR